MTTLTFDTLKFANRLKASGVPDKQAEAQAEILQTNLSEVATKRDLTELELRLKVELICWLIGVAAGQAAFIIAVLKLFPSR
jgi:hypothetical protein